MVLDIIYMVLTITIYDLYDQYKSNIEIPTPFPFSCEKRETFINGMVVMVVVVEEKEASS